MENLAGEKLKAVEGKIIQTIKDRIGTREV